MMHWTQPVMLAQRLLTFFSASPVPRAKPPSSNRSGFTEDRSVSVRDHEPLVALDGPPPDAPSTSPGMVPPSATSKRVLRSRRPPASRPQAVRPYCHSTVERPSVYLLRESLGQGVAVDM